MFTYISIFITRLFCKQQTNNQYHRDVQMKNNQAKKKKKNNNPKQLDAKDDADGIIELNNLLEKVYSIWSRWPSAPLDCIRRLKMFCEAIRERKEVIINDNDDTIPEVMKIMRDYHRMEQVEEKLVLITNENVNFQNEITNLRSEFTGVVDNSQKLETAVKKLEKKLSDSQTFASNKIITHVYAHLLGIIIDKVKQAFQTENERKLSEVDLTNRYNMNILKKIKDKKALNDNGKIVNQILEEFSNESKINKGSLINLLIEKADRNHLSHGFIELYIKDVLNGICREEDLFQYIEQENYMKIILSDQGKQLIMKLAHINIAYRKKQALIQSIFTEGDDNYNINGPLRMPIVEINEKNGIVMGKIESGCCLVGDQCVIMPNRTHVEITNIYNLSSETNFCARGANVRIQLKDIKEKILPGFILCDAQNELCGVGTVFDAEVFVLEYQSIIRRGYSAVLHIHAAVVDVQVKELITLIHQENNKTEEQPCFIKQDQTAVVRFELLKAGQVICIEPFKCFPRLGAFKLYDKNRMVAVGKVLEIIR